MDYNQFRGCQECIIFEICQGTSTPRLGSAACYSSSKEEMQFEDEMAPCNPLFWRYWDDVGGLHHWKFDPLLSPKMINVPTYIPMVRNGSRRVTHLEEEIVAIPLFKVFGKRNVKSYGSRFADGLELRRFFKIQDDARVILIGVSEDPALELFWQEHQVHKVFEELVALNVSGVTIPNFSAFEDMNRFDLFRNFKRVLLVADRLSKANIPAILHLNAFEPWHWRFWENLLRDHPEISVVCKEFQTGMKEFEKGIEAIKHLDRVQNHLNRRLHPILVGGGSYYREAANRFDSFTIVDSRPHMLSMSRTLLKVVSKNLFEEVPCPTQLHRPIDHIYRENLRVHADNLQHGRRNKTSKNDSCQMELDFSTSIPYLTAQLAA